jgi:hypothetical protein
MRKLVIDRLKKLIEDSDGEGIPKYFDCLESNYITDPDELNGLSDDALLDALEASSLGYF